MWYGWGLVVAVAAAQDVAALDLVSGLRGLDWGSAPTADMRRLGGNGRGRVQYTRPAEDRAVGGFRADAISYEYVDGALATVIVATRSEFDALGIRAELEAAYGPPTSVDDHDRTHVWRGERVRLVYRQQRADLWVVIYSWLPLHAGDTP